MKTAVVMVGGRGTRLWPLTESIPKPMVAIDHRPILEFVVAALRASGVRRILAVLQFKPGPIVAHFGDGSRFGIQIDYLLQHGDRGTAGSVRQALEILDDREFLVCSSDILFHGDLLPGMEFHQEREAEATLALTRVADSTGLGVARRNPAGRIGSFQEKPLQGGTEAAWVNTGIYFLDRRALERVPRRRRVDFGHDLFPLLAREGRPIYGWELPGYWRDVGTHAALKEARRDAGEVPGLRGMVTRWPAATAGDGGRIWFHIDVPGGKWLEMDTTTIRQAAGVIWKHLSEERENGATLAKLEKLKGVGSKEVLAAVGWLAREGKVQFKEERKTTWVLLAPAEAHSVSG